MKTRRTMACLRDDRGGITFIEVMFTFIIIVAAVIATAYSIYFGNRSLRVDMHKQQVLQLVEGEMEYWVGRMYTGTPWPNLDPNAQEMAGRTTVPHRVIPLDSLTVRQINALIFYDPIVPIYDPNELTPSGEPRVAYWIITVWGEWTEFDGEEFTRANGKAVKLTSYVARV